MKIIVDTSILIDYLRAGMKWQAFLTEAPRNAELFLPTIVVFELFSGKSTKHANIVSRIDDLLMKFEKIELTQEIAKRAGQLYRDIGKQIIPQDYIIAASALEIGGTVLTLNRKHFEQVPGLRVYPID